MRLEDFPRGPHILPTVDSDPVDGYHGEGTPCTHMAVEDSPVDHGYFSPLLNATSSGNRSVANQCGEQERSRDICSSIEVTPTGRPLANRSQISRTRLNDSSIIATLQQQQALLQEILSAQKIMTEKQVEMDKELCILKQKIKNAESTISTSSGCSSGGTSGKRKRTVSRTLSVSVLLLG